MGGRASSTVLACGGRAPQGWAPLGPLRRDQGVEPPCLEWGRPAPPPSVPHCALRDRDKCAASLSLSFLIRSLLTFPVRSTRLRPPIGHSLLYTGA